MKPGKLGLPGRAVAVFSAFAAAFTGLYLRVGYLSQSPELLEAAAQQKKYNLTISKTRGAIYDCNYTPMADTRQETVYAVMPSAENLLPVLEAVPVSRRTAVSEQFRTGKPFLLRDAEGLDTPGVEEYSVPIRTDSPQLAPHIIGYLDDAGHGVTGIEKSYDEYLASFEEETQAVYQLDGLGRGISGLSPEIREAAPVKAGVVLSIDANIQKIVENAGSKGLEKGAIVVMDPYTGEIKAMASFPSYRPDNLAQAVTDSENTPLINRALLPYSVGSTFKVVTASAALEQELPLDQVYECTGQINVSGQIFRCHRRSGHGEVDMVDAMMKSCNPYFIQLGLKIGGTSLLEMAKRFGFGETLPLAQGISGSAGTLPGETDLQNPAEVANLSFGQGLLTASPLQVTRMMAAAANGGVLVQPRLVLGTTPDGQTLERDADVPSRQILSPEIAAQIQAFLIHCVMVEEEQHALPGNVSAGGKTATAQTGRFDENGDELEHGWFSGFFPAENPRYVVTVLAENSGFGNDTAAPVFAEIAEEISARGW